MMATMPTFKLKTPSSIPPPPVNYANFGACLSDTQKERQECGAGTHTKNLPPIFSCPRPTPCKSTPGHPPAALDAFFTASKVKLLTQVKKEERRMDMAKFIIEARMGVWEV